MSAPSTIGAGKPTLRIRGTSYPVLLPRCATRGSTSRP